MTGPQFERMPPELTARDRWLLWRLRGRSKVPYMAAKPRTPAKSTDPNTWASFAATSAAFKPGRDSGVGFALHPDDGLAVVDIDGNTSNAAIELLRGVGCKYIETSPSGKGLHGWGFYVGELPHKKGAIDGLDVEIYRDARYMSVTGNVLQAAPFEQLNGAFELSQNLAKKTACTSVPTEETEETEVAEETEVSGGFGCVLASGAKLAELTPTDIRQRNKKLFELARYIKGLHPGAGKADLKATVQAWHRMALPVIGTKDFMTTWGDFMRGWAQVKYPIGAELARILEGVENDPLPPLPDDYGPRTEKLVRICRRLQMNAGTDPFFISARTAGDLLDIHFTDAAGMLYGLVADDVLTLVKRGSGRTASRYLLNTELNHD